MKDLQGLVEKDWIKKAAEEIFGAFCEAGRAGFSEWGVVTIAEVIGRNVPDGARACLLCHWESDEEKREHLPAIADAESGVYVCGECVGRTQTVTNFGLTVTELGKAAAEYKSKLESRPVQQPAQLIAAQQAEDEGLWCIPKTAMEGHLQKELRRLTEAVEGKTSAECLRELLLKPPVQQRATSPLLEELRKARTAWHKDFGVQVSFPYARFLNAIGAIEDAMIAVHRAK